MLEAARDAAILKPREHKNFRERWRFVGEVLGGCRLAESAADRADFGMVRGDIVETRAGLALGQQRKMLIRSDLQWWRRRESNANRGRFLTCWWRTTSVLSR
jgi:hypothetical protein